MARTKKPRKAYQPPRKENELQAIYNDCNLMMSKVSEFEFDQITDPTIIAKTKELQEKRAIFQERLEKIHTDNEPYHRPMSKGKRSDIGMGPIRVGEEYSQWMNDFSEEIVPLTLEIGALADNLPDVLDKAE